MRVLVACEFSGTVRDAFARLGRDAWSIDLLPTEAPGQHVQSDIMDMHDDWLCSFDLMVAHPPCKYLSVSGARWFDGRRTEQAKALAFVVWLMSLDIPRIAVENPIGVISTHVRKPDQIIQPWMFGHEERKATCLWLKHLPPLVHTRLMIRRDRNLTPSGQNAIGPSPERWKNRSRTYSGIAEAMACQWGCLQHTGSGAVQAAAAGIGQASHQSRRLEMGDAMDKTETAAPDPVD